MFFNEEDNIIINLKELSFMNPIKKIRKKKKLSLDKLSELIGPNSFTISRAEKGECLSSTCLTIIRKMSLKFDDIDDGKLIKEYQDWLSENDITLRE